MKEKPMTSRQTNERTLCLPGEIFGDAVLADFVRQVGDPQIPRFSHHVVRLGLLCSETAASGIVSRRRFSRHAGALPADDDLTLQDHVNNARSPLR